MPRSNASRSCKNWTPSTEDSKMIKSSENLPKSLPEESPEAKGYDKIRPQNSKSRHMQNSQEATYHLKHSNPKRLKRYQLLNLDSLDSVTDEQLTTLKMKFVDSLPEKYKYRYKSVVEDFNYLQLVDLVISLDIIWCYDKADNTVDVDTLSAAELSPGRDTPHTELSDISISSEGQHLNQPAQSIQEEERMKNIENRMDSFDAKLDLLIHELITKKQERKNPGNSIYFCKLHTQHGARAFFCVEPHLCQWNEQQRLKYCRQKSHGGGHGHGFTAIGRRNKATFKGSGNSKEPQNISSEDKIDAAQNNVNRMDKTEKPRESACMI